MASPLANIPPALKKITPYMKRAEELDRDVHHAESKAVAYYCRAYAMDQALLLRDPSNQKEVMPFLVALMDRLEADKKVLPVRSAQEGKALVQEFADKIFTKADEEDQIGVADKNTARTFYAAGVFYDVMQQFKDLLEPEVEKKRKYCKWKAADILNAIKEGRTPAPGGGYSASAEAAAGAEGGAGAADDGAMPPAVAETKPPVSSPAPQAPSSPPPPPYVAATAKAPTSPPPPPYQAPAPASKPAPAPAPAAAAKPTATGPKQAALDDAKELCYFAIAAINHKEAALAIERLEQAVQRLRSIA